METLSLPTMILFSEDDPIVNYKTMPINSIANNKNIKLITTEKGGHLCWF